MKRIRIVEGGALLNKTFALTCGGWEPSQIGGCEAGPADRITKPFSIGALRRKIRVLLPQSIS